MIWPQVPKRAVFWNRDKRDRADPADESRLGKQETSAKGSEDVPAETVDAPDDADPSDFNALAASGRAIQSGQSAHPSKFRELYI